jgi:hypothetical protein
VGMGEGECAGDAMRGLGAWGFKFPWVAGEACAGAGEPASEPNLIPDGGPVVGGVCLIWTEDLRACSPAAALLPLGPPLTMVGMVGTAGLMALPFTGETEELFPCCVP